MFPWSFSGSSESSSSDLQRRNARNTVGKRVEFLGRDQAKEQNEKIKEGFAKLKEQEKEAGSTFSDRQVKEAGRKLKEASTSEGPDSARTTARGDNKKKA